MCIHFHWHICSLTSACFLFCNTAMYLTHLMKQIPSRAAKIQNCSTSNWSPPWIWITIPGERRLEVCPEVPSINFSSSEYGDETAQRSSDVGRDRNSPLSLQRIRQRNMTLDFNEWSAHCKAARSYLLWIMQKFLIYCRYELFPEAMYAWTSFMYGNIRNFWV